MANNVKLEVKDQEIVNGKIEVSENNPIVYRATLVDDDGKAINNTYQTDITVSLKDGQTITIKQGEKFGEISDKSIQNAYIDGEREIEVGVDEAYYKQGRRQIKVPLDTTENSSFYIIATDDGNSTNVTIWVESVSDLDEDGDGIISATEDENSVTFGVTLEKKPKVETIVYVQMEKDGAPIGDVKEVKLDADQDTAYFDFVTQNSDVYVDSQSYVAKIVGIKNGSVYKDIDNANSSVEGILNDEFEKLEVLYSDATANIVDTIDDTKVSLSGSGDITEAGGDIVYTATLTHESQGETLVKTTLGDITIANGATTGTLTTTIASEEDVYQDERTINNAIISASGGNFEKLIVDETKDSVATKVKDTETESTVSLSTSDVTEDEDGVTFTATLSHKSQGETVVKTTLGDIMIANGATTGTLFKETKDSDVYLDVDTLDNAILSVSGGNFEKLVPNMETVTANIVDTIDIVNISTTTVVQGTNITFDISLSPVDTTLLLNKVKNDVVLELQDNSGKVINDVDGNPITITVSKDNKANATFDLIPGDYTGVKFIPTSGVRTNPDDLEESNSIGFDFNITLPLAHACLDVQEDLDICEEGNLFVNEKKFNLHVSDMRADYQSQLLTLDGEYGTIDINTSNGDYKYTLFNDTDKYNNIIIKDEAVQTNDDKEYIKKYLKVQGLREDQTETEEFEVGVGNNRGFIANKMVIVKVHGHNDIPVANDDDSVTMKEDDAPKVIDVLANDTDIDTRRPADYIFTLDSVEPTKNGYVHIVDNKLVFDTNGEFDYLKYGESADVSVKYAMSDEQGATSSAYANFKVLGVGEKPCPLEVNDDCLFISQGAKVTLDVLANDKGTGLKIIDVTSPDGGSAKIVDGKLEILYTAPSVTGKEVLMADEDTGFVTSDVSEPYLGSDRFTYTVEDSAAEKATATVSPHIKSASSHRDNFKGTDGSDFVIAGKGNDYLAGGKGDDFYYFSKGDGADIVMDASGSDDRIIFTPDNDSDITSTMKFSLDGNDLLIGYGSDDHITVKYAEENGHKRDTIGVERVVVYGETYLSENDIDKIIQTLSANSGSEMDINTMNEENKNNAIGQIVWHNG